MTTSTTTTTTTTRPQRRQPLHHDDNDHNIDHDDDKDNDHVHRDDDNDKDDNDHNEDNRNPDRDQGQICVVADSRDLLALERTREYNGRYHVLGGLISPMDGIGPEMLQITSLVARVDQEQVEEVILALTPSVEGDTTSLYLARLLRPFTTVSRIAYGLPVGSELEYADDVTLTRALEGRRTVE